MGINDDFKNGVEEQPPNLKFVQGVDSSYNISTNVNVRRGII